MTPKRQKFVREYMIDLNGTQAAIRSGYSVKTAREIARKLLTEVDVKEAIQKNMKKRSERTEVTAAKVITQLAKIAFADIKDFVEFGPEEVDTVVTETGDVVRRVKSSVLIKPSKSVDGTVLAEVSETKDGIKIKRNDQVKALELLGKHLGMFPDKVHVGGDPENLTPIATQEIVFKGIPRPNKADLFRSSKEE